MVTLAPEVKSALAAGKAVVGLESSVLAQGLPAPHNADAAQRMVAAVRKAGAVPAITGIVRGRPVAGLLPDELQLFLHATNVGKISSRDFGVTMARGGEGATTVAAALLICHVAGIRVFATGGIGGVHHGSYDESADLIELARTPAIVVCAGAKSILNLPATVERLETLSITVIGYRTSVFPGFHYADTGIPVPARMDSVAQIVDAYHGQRALGHPAAVLVVQPPPQQEVLDRREVESAITEALASAQSAGVAGAATTPWLLSALAQATGGRSLTTNLALLEANASLAAELAVELSRRSDS